MKFKPQIALSLCMLYTISVLGIALSMHFCGGKLASISAFAGKPACKYCKTESVKKVDDGCCKNTKVEVKVKDNHHGESAIKLPQLFEAAVFLPFKATEIIFSSTSSFYGRVENKAPPSAFGVALYILICVFRN